MRACISIPFFALAALSSTAAWAQTAAATKSPAADRSYVLGLKAGEQLREMGIAVDQEAMTAGIRDALANVKPRFSNDQITAVLTSLQSDMAAQRQEKTTRLARSNMTQGAAYLKANGAKPGVVTLPSGLQYEIIVAGKGDKPKLTDTVSCQYVGTLIDGVQFDASDKAGPPASFRVDGVIKGWTEVLQLMSVGSKWRVVIPANLAYGDHGAGAQIGPGATLVFEIEMVDIAAS